MMKGANYGDFFVSPDRFAEKMKRMEKSISEVDTQFKRRAS